MADGGHSFGKKTFHKPTYCHHCSDLLWGLIGQGYICEDLNLLLMKVEILLFAAPLRHVNYAKTLQRK
ncbi:Protein kinase C, eye isozyme, partial [Pseudolycoriella hygida]